MSLERQRQFTNGDTVLSTCTTASIEDATLSISTATGEVSLTLQETSELATFLQDQSTYPLVAQRLASIHQHILTGALTKETMYPILVELLIPFLPQAMLEHIQDILAALIHKGGGCHA